MAWKFSDLGLEKEARRLAGLVSAFALGTALLVLLGIIGGYFWSRFDDQQRDVAAELDHIRIEALQVVDWAADGTPRVRRGLNRILVSTSNISDADGVEDHFIIYGPHRHAIAEVGKPALWPAIRAQRPINAALPQLGSVFVERSMRPVLKDTALVSLIACVFAATVLFYFRVVPLRAFNLAMIRLDQSQRARSDAEIVLREHVVELERTKEALQKSADRLQTALETAAESSQAKSQFLASMSHELRTPLNAIIGFSEIMDRELFGSVDNPRYAEYIDLILNSGRHLLSLVNEILDLSKAGAGKLELYDGEIDLESMVRNIFRTMQPAANDAQVTLLLDIPPGLPRLRADPQRMTQILLNLVSNAIKFNNAGGSVRVVAERDTAEGMKIAVTDTGIGIAPENIPKALERFGQVEDSFTRRYQGTGLGLPISKKLIELHGGTLMLKSALGEGTCVTIWMPPERVAQMPLEGTPGLVAAI